MYHKIMLCIVIVKGRRRLDLLHVELRLSSEARGQCVLPGNRFNMGPS